MLGWVGACTRNIKITYADEKAMEMDGRMENADDK